MAESPEELSVRQAKSSLMKSSLRHSPSKPINLDFRHFHPSSSYVFLPGKVLRRGYPFCLELMYDARCAIDERRASRVDQGLDRRSGITVQISDHGAGRKSDVSE